MNRQYRYHLAGRNDSHDARRKHTCPGCQRQTYVLYIDGVTGRSVHPTVGKCDRADHCAYHYPPREYFRDNNMSLGGGQYKPRTHFLKQVHPAADPSFHTRELVKHSLANYGQNALVQWILRIMDNENAVMESVKRYYVGTAIDNGSYTGTLFWQVDTKGNIRAGKVIKYGTDGHRIKDGVPVIWVHSLLKKQKQISDFNLRQCLFGEHLLNNDPSKTVCVVESEKTAVIASIFLPNHIWLATGGCENIGRIIECTALRGRTVILCPDAGKYAVWNAKATQIRAAGIRVGVSDCVEKKAMPEQLQSGWDIADFLIIEGEGNRKKIS